MAELDEAICDMFIRGVSTAGVGSVMEALTGIQPSPSTVSRLFHSLESECEGWKRRSLKAHYLYVYADGTYFTVIYNQEGCKMPILAVVGIDETGQREVLAFCVGERENQNALGRLAQRYSMPAARSGGLSDFLPLPKAALEVYPHHQYHRTLVRRSQTPQQDGRCFS